MSSNGGVGWLWVRGHVWELDPILIVIASLSFKDAFYMSLGSPSLVLWVEVGVGSMGEGGGLWELEPKLIVKASLSFKNGFCIPLVGLSLALWVEVEVLKALDYMLTVVASILLIANA